MNVRSPLIAPRDRATAVLLVLVALTFVALLVTVPSISDIFSVRGAAACAAVLAFIKARFVAMDFMELRGTTAQRVADTWLLVVGLISLVLILR